MCRYIAASYIFVSALLTSSHAYVPDETECPHKADPEIFSAKYWVPPGTPFRAWMTLPYTMFAIRPSTIPKAGMGVFASEFIPANTWLGEYEGELLSNQQATDRDDYEYTWEIHTDEDVTHHMDAKEDHLSNWLRFINCPRHVVEENVKMHTCYGRVYYRTKRDIAPGMELFVYYGDNYATNNLGIDVVEYNMMEFADRNTSNRKRKQRKVSQRQCLNRPR